MQLDNIPMIPHSQHLDTLCLDGEPLAVACPEKLRLRLRFAKEARHFLEALNAYLAVNGPSSVTRLGRNCMAREARRACEHAMDALEAHRTNHRC
jgi:hypothetical protein